MSETFIPILPRGTALLTSAVSDRFAPPMQIAYQPFPNHPLTTARLARGLSIYRMADMLGLHVTTISGWVAGRNRPSRDSVRTMARLFDLGEDEIRGWFR